MYPDPTKLFFIVGTGRCGTTLLQAMLSSHPNIYIPPEVRYFGRHDPGVRFSDPLGDADVDAYLAVCRRDIWWQDMGLDQGAFDAAIRAGLRTSAEIYLWVLSHIADRRGNAKPRCGDKTPYYILFTERIAELFPRAKFIHLYRDPRDVVASYLEQYWVSSGTVLRVANYLRYVFHRAERAAEVLGVERCCAVKYEDLVANPELELRRLCVFLGEEYDPAVLHYRQRQDAGYLEVEEEWKGMTRQEITPSRIGRYASRLTPRQIWTVERALGPMLGAYGYESTTSGPVPVHWQAGYWGEQFCRKALRTVGVHRELLDEQSVLARRNALVKARARRA